ncbi:S-Ena type endospore appendage [Fredinandcohnia onubensis]|uniref:S-Ena type endospore appendage n=1 Tax=Fredinandcohnia onubensis TaxID=1571209 RepID=UPI000C0BDADA|nr:S-Ena type endospore appendage [Fredinandcohnia onubensis]
MQLTELKSEHKHCIRTKKVFDWVNRIVHIKEKEVISFPHKKEQFKDCICCDFKIKCNSSSKTLLWQGYGIDHVTASVRIKLNTSCGCELDIFVNGEKINTICEGQSFCGTIGKVKHIEIQCNGKEKHSNSCCCGDFELDIHYSHVEEPCNVDIKDAICFLSDEKGNPLDPYEHESIKCEEQIDEYPRENVEITLQNGKKVTLQKITVLKSGFITVKFLNSKNKICMVCTFPFLEYETFHLCAPEGTTLKCEITDFECKVKILPHTKKDTNCIKVQIFIQICQSIQVIGEVKVEVSGVLCNPREEIKDTINCPPPAVPEVCPMVPS